MDPNELQVSLGCAVLCCAVLCCAEGHYWCMIWLQPADVLERLGVLQRAGLAGAWQSYTLYKSCWVCCDEGALLVNGSRIPCIAEAGCDKQKKRYQYTPFY